MKNFDLLIMSVLIQKFTEKFLEDNPRLINFMAVLIGKIAAINTMRVSEKSETLEAHNKKTWGLGKPVGTIRRETVQPERGPIKDWCIKYGEVNWTEQVSGIETEINPLGQKTSRVVFETLTHITKSTVKDETGEKKSFWKRSPVRRSQKIVKLVPAVDLEEIPSKPDILMPMPLIAAVPTIAHIKKGGWTPLGPSGTMKQAHKKIDGMFGQDGELFTHKFYRENHPMFQPDNRTHLEKCGFDMQLVREIQDEMDQLKRRK